MICYAVIDTNVLVYLKYNAWINMRDHHLDNTFLFCVICSLKNIIT